MICFFDLVCPSTDLSLLRIIQNRISSSNDNNNFNALKQNRQSDGDEHGEETLPARKGGTKAGSEAFGKDAAATTKAGLMGKSTQKWEDSRWVNGTWDLAQFAKADGTTDWNAVIDAEIVHRKMLEENPAVYDEDGTFDLGQIPWQVWMMRFHLPEAEKANGRAAMVGYLFAYLIDAATHTGLVELHDSFLGKTAIFATVMFVCFVRQLSDLDNLKVLADEATFYDKQWQQSWVGVERPSEKKD